MYVQDLYDKFGDLKVLDDIIRHGAADDPQLPILGYPRSESSVSDYEQFTGRNLDRFVDAVVKKLITLGMTPSSEDIARPRLRQYI